MVKLMGVVVAIMGCGRTLLHARSVSLNSLMLRNKVVLVWLFFQKRRVLPYLRPPYRHLAASLMLVLLPKKLPSMLL